MTFSQQTLGKGDTFDFTWPGGRGVINIHGTWDGVTATLSALAADGSSYDSLGTDVELTADGWQAFVMGPRAMRVTVSGSGSGTDLDVYVSGTERP